MSIIGSVLIILACLAASAFFSGSETALFRLRSHDLDPDKEGFGPADVAVRDLTSSSSRLLVTILLGNNVVNILGASVASGLAISLLGAEAGIPVATAVMTALVLLFCEILPKAVAARHPRGVSRAVGLPLYLFHQILRPLHGLFDRAIEPLVRRVTGGVDGERSLGSEEVLRLAREALDSVEDAGSPLAIIGATSNAAEMDVSEIMVPRTEIEAFPSSTTVSELMDSMLESRYTRVPIYEGSIDHVLGVVHLKDLMKLDKSGVTELFGIVKPVLRVPERKPILRLLTEMQRAFCHIALVKDEFGVTQGLVTQEDILEEIVGEIRDEFDSEELLTIRKLRDGSYEALGRIKVLDFNRETGWQVPAEKGDTIGGLIFNTLERAPRKGERVGVPGYRLECTDVSGSRIVRVRVVEMPRDEDFSD
ncbi:MAG: HlyC/CorC family transporter [Spirochaetaceae bacterium]|nr:HlyC/CorC family transporter [Myxococcales bacterium]MCB9726515.1 HlyC/CorC family transporter [Spirochaetaceae bacterium]